MEQVSRTLSEIAEITKTMLSSPEDERILLYKRMDPLFLSLEAELMRSPNAHASERLEALKSHLVIMARLDDPDGHSDDQHLEWALSALDALRDPRCFGSNLQR